MTADELASFRALLRAQAETPPRRARFFAGRGGARAAVAPAPNAPVWSAPAPTAAPAPEPVVLVLAAAAAMPADPPPRTPPLFGRRELDGSGPEPASSITETDTGELLTLRTPAEGENALLWEVPTSAADIARTPTPPPAGVAPGGWTRARPPSAQRRLLARLEAVFLAERMGLDARRAAQQG